MHGPSKETRTGNPLELGKEGWRTLEGRSETWPRRYLERKHRNPTLSVIQGCSDPRRREGIQAGDDVATNCWRAPHHEHEQKGQQEEGDHPAHTRKQE
jgi:hypothetical protein